MDHYSARIEQALYEVLTEAVTTCLPLDASFVLPPLELQIPKKSEHGDLATAISLRLASCCKRKPLDIAGDITAVAGELIAASALLSESIADIAVVPPGFINISFSPQALYKIVREVISARDEFGKLKPAHPQKINIEFVSANPTGPLSVAHGRQAAIGDSLAHILLFAGHDVTREYYLNDEGRQIYLLGCSIKARYDELTGGESSFPDDGYKGAYVYDIARAIIAERGEELIGSDDITFFSQFGLNLILKGIQQDLSTFRVMFDVWRSQHALTAEGAVEATLQKLSDDGHIFDNEGALWFRTTVFGDDKDRVVKKSDGSYTYLAPDIAYHRDKFARGFDKLIDILGPDHHGYIARIKAAVCALGHNKDDLDILIVQLAKLFKGNEQIRMSTRAGEFISLREVFEEVGVDNARFFFLMRRRDSHLDFDLELAKKHSLENPVYYIQYAYARICSIFSAADNNGAYLTDTLDRLEAPEEIALIRKVREFPDIIAVCAQQLEPSILTTYLQDIAGEFHYFYTVHRVVTDDQALTQARLCLCDAVRVVLDNGLRLLGMGRPEKM